MITLKESILSSTRTGKDSLIKEWCEKHLSSNNYKINSKGEIEDTYECGISIIFHQDKPIPSYIRFGKIEGDFYIGNEINSLSKEQFPKSMNTLVLKCDIESLELKVSEINTMYGIRCLSSTVQNFKLFKKGVKKVKVFVNANNFHDIYSKDINLEETYIKLKDLKNIEVVGNNVSIMLQYTPASKSLKKLYKEYKEKYAQESVDYIKLFIENELPNLKDSINYIVIDNYIFKKFDDGTWIEMYSRR